MAVKPFVVRECDFRSHLKVRILVHGLFGLFDQLGANGCMQLDNITLIFCQNASFEQNLIGR